jgi:hypothetical protein
LDDLLFLDHKKRQGQKAVNAGKSFRKLAIRLLVIENRSSLGSGHGLQLMTKVVPQDKERFQSTIGHAYRLVLFWLEAD